MNINKQILLISILCMGLLHAQAPGPSGSLSAGEVIDDKKAVKKVWKNVKESYKMARMTAKTVVAEMKLISAFAHSMENMLQNWENIAKRTEEIFSKKKWGEILTSNPIKLIENLEEDFFQPNDKLLLSDIPNALESSRRYEASRQAWLNGEGGGLSKRPAIDFTKKKIEYLVHLTGLAEFQLKSMNADKKGHQHITKTIATATAKNDAKIMETANNEAQLDNIQAILSGVRAGDDNSSETGMANKGLKQMAEVGVMESENSFFMSQRKVDDKINYLEVMSNIQATQTSGYARQNTFSYLMVAPIVSLADEIGKLQEDK